MAKIYNRPTAATRFNTYSTDADNFTHNFNITANELHYQFINTTKEITIYNIKINLNDLKSNNSFADQTYWSIDDNVFVHAVPTEPFPISYLNLVPLLDNTITSKRSAITLRDVDKHDELPFIFFVDSVNGDFTTFSYFALTPADNSLMSIQDEVPTPEHTVSIEVNSPHTHENTAPGWKSSFSAITATSANSSAAAGDVVNVTVTTDTNLSKVYLEPIIGILDRTEVHLTNGSGSFNILTSTLTAGETATVKIGHKKFSNVTKFTQVLQ